MGMRLRARAFQASGQPACKALASLNKAARQEHYDQDEEQAQRQMPSFADEFGENGNHQLLQAVWQEGQEAVQYVGVDRREDVLEIFDEPCADYRAVQRTHPAQDRHETYVA